MKGFPEQFNKIWNESLFWNHGDRTDWLKDNDIFLEKKQLLEANHICVWRFHDYMHAGIPFDGKLRDGIFYGLSTMLGWNDYIVDTGNFYPDLFKIPETTAEEMGEFIMDKFRLKGVRFLGNPDCRIKKVYIPMHIMGMEMDNKIIEKISKDNIDCIMTLELVDFTVNEHIRDAGMLHKNKCLFALGHFNLEEIGMEMLERKLPEMIKLNVPVKFVQSGDTYSYIIKK